MDRALDTPTTRLNLSNASRASRGAARFFSGFVARAALLVAFAGGCTGSPNDDTSGHNRPDDDEGLLTLSATWDYAEGFSIDEREVVRWDTSPEAEPVDETALDASIYIGRYYGVRGAELCAVEGDFEDVEDIESTYTGCENHHLTLGLIGESDFKMGTGLLIKNSGRVLRALVVDHNSTVINDDYHSYLTLELAENLDALDGPSDATPIE